MKSSNKLFLYCLFLFLFGFFCNLAHAETDIYGGTISTDTTWTKEGSPYVIYDSDEDNSDFTVGAGATLTMEAGTIVKFDYDKSINVYGRLIANGTQEEKVYFTSINDDSVGGDIGLDEGMTEPFFDDWTGIEVGNGGSTELKNSVISYAITALLLESATSTFDNLLVVNCMSGLFVDGSSLRIINSNINDIFGDALILSSTSSVSFIYSSIKNIEGDGVAAVFGSNINIENSNIENISGDALFVYSSSTLSTKSTTISGVEGDAFGVYENSLLNFENSSLLNISGWVLDMFGSSTANIDNSSVRNSEGGLELFYNSVLNMTNSIIENIGGAMDVFNNSILNITGSQINGVTNGNYVAEVFNGSRLVFSNSSLQNVSGVAIEAFGSSDSDYSSTTLDISSSTISGGNKIGLQIFGEKMIANISKSKIKNFAGDGIQTFSYPTITVTDSEISGNDSGIMSWGTNLDISNSIISGNKKYGISNNPAPDDPSIKAINNWWGDACGPFNADTNASGTANQVTSNVEFSPWLTEDPSIIKKIPVIIVPGILSSYLNKNTYDNVEVWPNIIKALYLKDDDYLDELAFNQMGVPDLSDSIMLPTDIFRKIQSSDFSEGLINELKNKDYVENKNLFVFPYDWRLDIRDNVDDLYSPLLTTLKDKIDQVLVQTESEKVDIIAHSMGGLLSKYYIEHYGQGKINKFIDIATPHLGAPSALKTLMYGDDLGIKLGILGLNSQEIKKIAQNFPAIYQLLPSQNYFSNLLPDYNYYVYDMNDYDSDGVMGRLSLDQTQQFLKNTGRNSLVLDSAVSIHDDLDDVNPADYGVKTYNIIGCGTPTIGKIFALGKQTNKDSQYDIAYISGDGTVPQRSAEAIPSTKQYYVSSVEHATMPSANSIKELVGSILSRDGDDYNYASNTNVSTTSAGCKLTNGTFIGFHSPVELHIYDGEDNHTGPDSNGDLEFNIPGIAYDIIDENKFAYLPDGYNYRIELKAMEVGSFSAHIKRIQDENIVSTDYFNDIPLSSTSTTALVDITSPTPKIVLDEKGDGFLISNILPSATLSSSSIGDLIPPQTAISVSTDGMVSLLAIDDNAGVLKTEYSYDGKTWILYTGPFNAAGKTIDYLSIDNAGNSESKQSIFIPARGRLRSHNYVKTETSTSTVVSVTKEEINIPTSKDNNQSALQTMALEHKSQLLPATSTQLSPVSSSTIKTTNVSIYKKILPKNLHASISTPTPAFVSEETSRNSESVASVMNSRINPKSIIDAFIKLWSRLFLFIKNI